MIPDTDRAAAGFLFHVIRAAEVDQPEQVVGQSWVRFQVRPCGGSPVPSATKAAASWLARRLHAPHRRGTHGRSFPAVTLPRPGRQLAGLSHDSGSSSSVPRRRVLRSARPSTERTLANLRRSHRPLWPIPCHSPACRIDALFGGKWRNGRNVADPLWQFAAARRGKTVIRMDQTGQERVVVR